MEADREVRWSAVFTRVENNKCYDELEYYIPAGITLPQWVAQKGAEGLWDDYVLTDIKREGVPWSPEEFRDGAYYKDGHNNTALVLGVGCRTGCMAVVLVASDGTPCGGASDHDRITGAFTAFDGGSKWDLIPNEVDRYGEPIVNAILNAATRNATNTPAATDYERQRAPLDWQSDVKPFDPFKGWFTGQDDDLGPIYDHEVKHTGQGTYGDEGSDAGWAGKVAKLPGAWGENEYTGNLKR